ncbi:MAG TPA: beta-ketoacyl-ACP synthase III [Lacipirellulaceae bacterium]|nr:beta-ketoacyl-ACP synthase III [Lacipirellulaceae bacterium]
MSDSSTAVGGAPVRRLPGVQIVGTGSFVPDNVVTNEDLASLGCDADWILQRTGIKARRHAPAEMTTSDMAVAAAERALEAADVERRDVDLLILATLSPDRLLPATATAVQHRLGLNCAAMDLSAACAGFAYALATGIQFVASTCSHRALIIGADANSRVIDPGDKKTYPLFGDGAGAVVLAPGGPEQGALAYTLGADGAGADLLCRTVGGAAQPFRHGAEQPGSWYIEMDGRPVFKWAVRVAEESARQVVEAAQWTVEEVDCWLLHQANVRILDAAIDALGVRRERVVMHMDRYGNTSAASIPLALDETLRAEGIRRGDQLVMSGFGAGLTWGTIAWRW